MGLAKTIRIWTCDACGHTAPWGEGWRSKLVMHRKPVPYDEELVVCSEACAKKLDARRKRVTPNDLANPRFGREENSNG